MTMPDVASLLPQQGGGGYPGAQPGAAPMGAPQGPSPMEQAVWAMFPSTDPSFVQSLAQKAGGAGSQGLAAVLPDFLSQQEQDRQKFQQLQDQQDSMLLQLLSGPVGGPQGQAQPPTPAVGPDTQG